MEVKFKFDTTAEKQLFKTLKTLPIQMQASTLIKAARTAMRKLANAAKAAAPVESGTLQKSISYETKIYDKGETLYGIVGINRKSKGQYKNKTRIPKFYAILAEIKHGFMRRTWESEKNNLQKYFEDYILKQIKKYTKASK